MIDKIYLLMGSNLGDRVQNLKNCLNEVENRVGKVLRVSSIYETEAWGLRDQDSFLNVAMEVSSDLSPKEMITIFDEIEKNGGREKTIKWGPRVIDLDILYYSDIILKTLQLQIPHKEIQNRNFVLVPMIELNKDFIHPVFNKTQNELLELCKDNLEVKDFSLDLLS